MTLSCPKCGEDSGIEPVADNLNEEIDCRGCGTPLVVEWEDEVWELGFRLAGFYKLVERQPENEPPDTRNGAPN